MGLCVADWRDTKQQTGWDGSVGELSTLAVELDFEAEVSATELGSGWIRFGYREIYRDSGSGSSGATDGFLKVVAALQSLQVWVLGLLEYSDRMMLKRKYRGGEGPNMGSGER
ncbi:hypothetical protein F0562_005974 [Nyssa sinensis]|uniref:Uncharacterized protein n=1 Tax=Nyssa sinensis TaxID=561372 RepID=A0A5J5APE0_9ASTE|nr:hypothetical protein F0562_005974 [Nyssa sinensis]